MSNRQVSQYTPPLTPRVLQVGAALAGAASNGALQEIGRASYRAARDAIRQAGGAMRSVTWTPRRNSPYGRFGVRLMRQRQPFASGAPSSNQLTSGK